MKFLKLFRYAYFFHNNVKIASYMIIIPEDLVLGIVNAKAATAVLACSRSDLSKLCEILWTRLW